MFNASLAKRLRNRKASRSARERQRRPTLEGLEERALLSMTHAVHHPHHAAIHVREDGQGRANAFLQTNLVSDQAGVAQIQDPSLVNPWGMAFSSTSPFWLSDNGTGVSTLYRQNLTTGAVSKLGLTVTVPLPPGSTAPNSGPSGMLFNGSSDFVVTSGTHSGKAIFIWATEDGTISGWNPTVDATHAILAADKSADGAVYKGIAMAENGGANFLYAANFNSGKVDVFDTHFAAVAQSSDSFHDARIPANFAPFNVQNIGGKLFVTYAKQDAAKHDPVHGVGLGFVDIFNTDGTLFKRLIQRGLLNAPWGVTIAPSTFGRFGGDLLVGNFGDGRLNAYDPNTGELQGRLKTPTGKPLVIDGLWALAFGNGVTGAADTLYFSAGPNDESHGLFGSLQAVARAEGGD